jgi:phage-related baseplate assembly protein
MSVFVDNLEVADLNLESYSERGSHSLYAHHTRAVPRLREMNASATAPVSADAPVPGPVPGPNTP